MTLTFAHAEDIRLITSPISGYFGCAIQGANQQWIEAECEKVGSYGSWEEAGDVAYSGEWQWAQTCRVVLLSWPLGNI